MLLFFLFDYSFSKSQILYRETKKEGKKMEVKPQFYYLWLDADAVEAQISILYFFFSGQIKRVSTFGQLQKSITELSKNHPKRLTIISSAKHILQIRHSNILKEPNVNTKLLIFTRHGKAECQKNSDVLYGYSDQDFKIFQLAIKYQKEVKSTLKKEEDSLRKSQQKNQEKKDNQDISKEIQTKQEEIQPKVEISAEQNQIVFAEKQKEELQQNQQACEIMIAGNLGVQMQEPGGEIVIKSDQNQELGFDQYPYYFQEYKPKKFKSLQEEEAYEANEMFKAILKQDDLSIQKQHQKENEEALQHLDGLFFKKFEKTQRENDHCKQVKKNNNFYQTGYEGSLRTQAKQNYLPWVISHSQKERKIEKKRELEKKAYTKIEGIWFDPNNSRHETLRQEIEMKCKHFKIRMKEELDDQVFQEFEKKKKTAFVLIFSNSMAARIWTQSSYPFLNVVQYIIYCANTTATESMIKKFSPEEIPFYTASSMQYVRQTIRLVNDIKAKYRIN